MNRKALLTLCCLPLLVNASDPRLKKELNGLPIEVHLGAVASQGGSMPAPMTGEGLQTLTVINHSDMQVRCKVDPPSADLVRQLDLAPKQRITLSLDSRASSGKTEPSLVCVPAHTSHE